MQCSQVDCRQFENDKQGPVPSRWTFKSEFGIVHAMNCAVCRSYMTHVAIANRSGDASFKDALNDKENRINTAFLDGFQSGREAQQDNHDNNSTLARYRDERDEALQGLDAAKKDLAILQNRVLALELMQQDLVSGSVSKGSDEAIGSSTEPSAKSDTSSMEQLLLSPLENLNDDITFSIPISTSDNEVLRTRTSPSLSTVTENRDVLQTTNKETPKVLFSNPTSDVEPLGETKVSTSKLSLGSPQRSTCTPSLSSPSSDQQSSSIPTTTPIPQQLATIAQLKALIKVAHSGDNSSLARIRAFCGTAHRTPRNKRTELQRYALLHWRNQPPSVSSFMPETVLTTFGDGMFSTEVHVDASAWGIGFVMDGLWLAWKFSDLPVLSNNSIDSNWAEMLAVEVGLWTVIHWVCGVIQKEGDVMESVKIVIHSDNAGVVKAVEKRHSNHPPQQDVLLRILGTLTEYDIQLSMRWISSIDNLADGPSRGFAGPASDLLPFIPPLPSHLSDILSLMTVE